MEYTCPSCGHTEELTTDTKTKPTEQECIDGLAQLQADYDQAIIDRENKKASAKSKLEALGLTTEEIKEAFGI